MRNKVCSKKIILSLVIPCLVVILSIVLALTVGFNKGMDYNGGIEVSVMAQDFKFDDTEKYNEFKLAIDEILDNSGVKGGVYITERDSATYNDVLVIKIDYNGDLKDEKITSIKEGLVARFYADKTEVEINNLHLVSVSSFDGFVNASLVLKAILASLIAAILISVYLGLRLGVHLAFFGISGAFISNALSIALIMITRLKINAYFISIIPLVTIISLLITFIFERRAKRLIKSNEKYEKLSNEKLAHDALKSGFKKKREFAYCIFVLAIGFALCNISSQLFYYGLALAEVIAVLSYVYMFIIPSIFELTYVRKYNKKTVSKKEEKIERKLTEEEVMTETNLNDLTSN